MHVSKIRMLVDGVNVHSMCAMQASLYKEQFDWVKCGNSYLHMFVP